jgi:CBS domain-containing protein
MGEAADLPQSTVAFLRRHPPFNEMDDASLEDLAGRAKLVQFARGNAITGPAAGVARTLFIVQRGLALGHIAGAAAEHRLEFGPGEAFPISAVVAARPTTTEYEAADDLFCYEVDVETVERLMRTSPPFQRYCTRHMGSLLAQAADRLRHEYSQQALGSHAMLAPLGTTLRRKPVTCAPETPLVEALGIMQKHKVSAVVVADANGQPVGIFTERDLVRHTAAGAVDRNRAISAYMTPDPISLPVTATAAEAVLLMTRRNIRHLLVCEAGRLAGVVSERGLFALQRLSMREVTHVIEMAEDVGGLKVAAREIRNVAKAMLAQGVGAEQLTQLIAVLNDKLTERILELEAGRHDLAGIRFCWLALGSEGRHEQTFATDQDNALVFAVDDGGEAAAVRGRLLPFARAVNETLDACGFPLCKGNIMASNPEWCLSEGEWRERFGQWIRSPVPGALLNATIFFDFRPLWGETAIARRLREWLREGTRDDQRFLRMMAANALQTEPPLGFFGDIVTRGKGGQKGTVDLKSQGSRVITDVARIYALAAGVEASNTAARIRQAGKALRIREEESEAVIDAFYFLLLLRLRHQHLETAAAGDADANRLNPRDLNELDLRILKESFRQARKLQRRLSLDYQL